MKNETFSRMKNSFRKYVFSRQKIAGMSGK